MTRYITLAIVAMLLVTTAVAKEKTQFNVDIFCGWDNHYRPMQWTPIEIGISTNLTEDRLNTEIVFSARQDGMNTMNITHECVLIPDLPLNLPLVTKFAFGADKCTLAIIDKDSRRKYFQDDFSLWTAQNTNRLMTVLNRSDFLAGLIGSRKFSILKLPESSVSRIAQQPGKVFVAPKYAKMAPWDWTGYSSLDILVLYNPDWDIFNQHQIHALTQWLANGGNLLIVLGTNPFPRDSELAKLLPFEPQQGGTELTIESQLLSRLSLNSEQAVTAVCNPLKQKPDARFCRSWNNQSDRTLFATGYAGFGRVGILAFDPAILSDQVNTDPARFWVKLISDIITCGDEKITVKTPVNEVSKRTNKYALIADSVHPDDGPGGIKMTLEGLTPGNYKINTYHNALTHAFGSINILVNGDIQKDNFFQSGVWEEDDVSKAEIKFLVTESGKTEIEFRPHPSSTSPRAALSGFELTKQENQNPQKKQNVLNVDFGTTGQTVAKGFVGLGTPRGSRTRDAKARRIELRKSFNSSDGLPEGITITLETQKKNDNLEFTITHPMPQRNQRRPRTRTSQNIASTLTRTIEYQTEPQLDLEQQRSQRRGRGFFTGFAQAGLNAVMEHLYHIAQMKPLSIWWVILLLTMLAILLGPVDYLVLKRLDRLPMTWLTCAMWIALFTVGAYYGVQAIRGGEMQLRAVSVVDAVDANSPIFSTTYSGLFAPYSADYKLDGLKSNQWWSAISPAADNMYQAMPSIVSRDIYCFQHDGGNIPYSLPINIWTMQCLLTESSIDTFPFSATFSRHFDNIKLTITNLSDHPITGGFVLLDHENMIKFRTVGAHATKEFSSESIEESIVKKTLRRANNNQPYIRFNGSFQIEKALFAQGSLQRTRAIQRYLDDGAAVICAHYENLPFPFEVKGRSYTSTHQQIARLVVFPEDNSKIQNTENRKVSMK